MSNSRLIPALAMGIVMLLAAVLGIAVLVPGRLNLAATQTPGPLGGGCGQIAYLTWLDGHQEIFVMDVDGNNRRNLTNNVAEDFQPNWAYGGSDLLFTSMRDGGANLYAIDVASGEIRQISTGGADVTGVWSPDKSQIAFMARRGRANRDIWVMDADGSNPINLTNSPGSEFTPGWTPDGRITFDWTQDQNRDIYVMNADGSNLQRLTDDPAVDQGISWSPDGKSIIFESDRDQTTPQMFDLFIMDANGANLSNLTHQQGNSAKAAWSPDGKYILFDSDRNGGDLDVYLMELATGEVTNLTADDPLDNEYPTWCW